MKIKKISVLAMALAGTMLFSSCIGSFSLFNKFASWITHATGNKYLNAIIGIIISPVYAICGTVDWFVLNTIEFWTGDNPIAQKEGKTESVIGSDGLLYAVKYLKNGYEITKPDGSVVNFTYDAENNAWLQESEGQETELLRFNSDGTVKVTLPNGEQKDISLNEEGVSEIREAVNVTENLFAFN